MKSYTYNVKLIIPSPLVENADFRTGLSELVKRYGYVLTWESSTEAWLHDVSAAPESGNYPA